MREIRFYRTDSGHCPVEQFLDSLTARQAQKVTWVFQLIEEMKLVPIKYFKKLSGTKDLWEIRVQFENNIYRFLGFMDGSNIVILNHAFHKKTKKTPLKEIAIAETRKKDYLKRIKKDE